MLKLMKYEFRKSWFSRIVLLIAIGGFELMFLYGALFTDMKNSGAVAWGIIGLIFVTIAGISFIGLESLINLHKDLNTKQSYMLFMTPRNGYQILGAKILENGLCLFITSIFFLLLAGIDISILTGKLGSVKEVFQMMQKYMDLNISWESLGQTAGIYFLEIIISWFSAIVTGYLAIIISSALLAGKKMSGVVSFLLYLLLVTVQSKVAHVITDTVAGGWDQIGQFAIESAVTLIFAVVIYFISCWAIDRKLSV